MAEQITVNELSTLLIEKKMKKDIENWRGY